MNAHYYAQRASAGLIVTEPAQISPQGQGGWGTPGMYSDAQEVGWRGVAGAVHARHGRIALQLWHAGRVSHRRLQVDAAPPVAPSAIRAGGVKVLVLQDDGTPALVDADDPRPLETDEIPGIVLQYVDAAHRADRAGFGRESRATRRGGDGSGVGCSGRIASAFACRLDLAISRMTKERRRRCIWPGN